MNSRLSVLAASRVLCTVSCCLFAAAAQAHDGVHDGLIAGLMHPVSGLDHVLAMVAVGVWSAMLAQPFIWLLPTSFLALMVVGGGFGAAGIAMPFAETAVAVSLIVRGLAIAFAWRATLGVAFALIGLFGAFHGYAHGVELSSAASPATYAFGFLLTTVALHLIGIGAGLLTRLRRGAPVLRVGGYAIAQAGAWLLLGSAGVL